MAFLTFDVILAKHYLSPEHAGQYALLSLIGKTIYFLGSLPNALMITLISNRMATKQNITKHILSFLFIYFYLNRCCICCLKYIW